MSDKVDRIRAKMKAKYANGEINDIQYNYWLKTLDNVLVAPTPVIEMEDQIDFQNILRISSVCVLAAIAILFSAFVGAIFLAN